MNNMKNDWRLVALAVLAMVIISLAFVRAEGQSIQDPPFGRPDAIVDLASHEGAQLVKANGDTPM